jgi:Domain of Unknown Function (DUF928)
MPRPILLFRKGLQHLLLTSCVLSMILISTPIAFAAYTPRNPSAPRTPTTTTGTRGGCPNNQEITLTALAPQSHVGQTISTHPTVAWFIPSAPSLPMEFRLYQYDSDAAQQLIYRSEIQSTSGIMSWSLPTSEPPLEIGQRYRWQVILFCDPNRPSSALVADAELEVVVPDSTLEQDLVVAVDRPARAELYAKEGLWYDAFNETLNVSNDTNLETIRLGLLESLVSLERTSNSENAEDLSVLLNQVIEIERQ